MRPYEEVLIEASRTGRVLKRQHIYGSGPPVDELSGDAQNLVKEYCSNSVVDFGAGCGALQQYLPASCRYLGIEKNPVGVQMAKEKGRNVILGDVLKTGLADNSYEVCTMVEVLEHINDYEAALSEVRRVAASRLVMTVPNIGVIPALSEFLVVPWHLLEATHVNFFTAGSLKQVLLRVFPRVKVWEINQWFQPDLHMNIAAVAWKH
jgi:ubiquinone/menaquinone biosynthesis C-methylase UbiE